MEIVPYDPRLPYEDMAARVDFFERSYDMTVPLAETEGLTEALGVLQRRTAYEESRVVTGYRSREEQVQCLEANDMRISLMRIVGSKATYQVYMQTNDTGKAKKALATFVEETEQSMLEFSYGERLRLNNSENFKEVLAHRPVLGQLLPEGLAKGATAMGAVLMTKYLVESSEASLSNVEATLSQGKLLGALALLATIGMGSAKKSWPRKMGSFIRSRVRALHQSYALERHMLVDENGTKLPREAILKKYAERDLTPTFEEIGRYLNQFDMNGVEDIEPMVAGVLGMMEQSMFERCNISLEEPWYRRLTGQMTDPDSHKTDTLIGIGALMQENS